MNARHEFILVLSFNAVIKLMVAMPVIVSKDISQKTVTSVTMLMSVSTKSVVAEIIVIKMQIA